MYLDDLLIATQTVQEHLEILREGFSIYSVGISYKFDGINARFFTRKSRI